MYEELNTPIPDLSAYLRRLGYLNPNTSLPCDLHTLNELIYNHHTHIPFEDLEPHLEHSTPSLEIADIFDKVIVRNRGGYCFELNALFTRLLQQLGYKANSVFCRIVRGRDLSGEMPPCTHRGIIVDIDQKQYFCDVGYGGPMPPFAIQITDGFTETQHDETFHINHLNDCWWCLSRTTSDGSNEDVLHLNTTPQTPTEFIPVNYMCSTKPDFVFVTTLLVNIRTETGSKSITNDIFTIRDEKQVSTMTIQNREELCKILQAHFGITFTPQ